MNLFIKIEQDVAVGYPLIESNLRYVFPDLPTGFLRAEVVNPLGYAPYTQVQKPVSEDLTKEYVEGTSVKNIDNYYVQTWEEQDKVFASEEDKAEAEVQTTENRLESIRLIRNNLLEQTDKYALQDLVMTDEMVTYRQALRDLPSTVDVISPQYPVSPIQPQQVVT